MRVRIRRAAVVWAIAALVVLPVSAHAAPASFDATGATRASWGPDKDTTDKSNNGQGSDDKSNNGQGSDDKSNNGQGSDDKPDNGQGSDDKPDNGQGSDDKSNNGVGPADKPDNGQGPDDKSNNGVGPEDKPDNGAVVVVPGDLDDAVFEHPGALVLTPSGVLAGGASKMSAPVQLALDMLSQLNSEDVVPIAEPAADDLPPASVVDLGPVLPPVFVEAMSSPIVIFEALVEAMLSSGQALVIPFFAAAIGFFLPGLRRRDLISAVALSPGTSRSPDGV